MAVPKKYMRRAGVTNIPSIFPITALAKEAATFPPADAVNNTHMFTVVGKQVSISSPSNNALGRKLGIIRFRIAINGTPTRKGQAKKDPA